MAPVPGPRAELRSRPILPAREPAEPSHRAPTGALAPPVEVVRENGAAAERLIRPLPVPVFPRRHAGEPAPSPVQAASLPVWQETPAAHPAPRHAAWTPAAGGDLKLRPILVRALKLGCLGALGCVLLLATLIVLYRWVDPPRSMLMLGQRLGGMPITQHWLSLEHISSNLQLAVIASEDGRFCRHHGVDWEELESAIDQSVDGIARGGSTIAMQTVKNLFLWPAKSYVRKAIEIPLAYAVDATWSKRRLLEIYLNIAEWGPGIFGAEAAARYHFRKPASLLSPREAALLAVSLPNPFERRAGAPGPGTQRLAANLMLRMRAAPGMARCVRSGTGL
ncbi:MAG TPA: monofunctional biosynthetic peptidoglycan transglycosylase [Hyphomicrobiaceae bacterium]|nr:monofunctional biosynthetic peptidoglycan transglycosylase [Hyphomicrobiaceae bacterium]